MLPPATGAPIDQLARWKVWWRPDNLQPMFGYAILAAGAAKKKIAMAKKVKVKAKSCITFQLRGLRFKRKSHQPTIFAQGIVWHPKEYLK